MSELRRIDSFDSAPHGRRSRLRWGTGCVAAVALTLSGGCAARQQTFATPDDAVRDFVAAVRTGDGEQGERILGRGARESLASGDDVADRQAREKFIKAYDEKSALTTEPDGSVTLQVGNEEWPMPIPLVKRGESWRFDWRRGREEILNRRIGRNELSAIGVCLATVDAQREYASLDRDGDGTLEYAEKFVSDSGIRNGLYWKSAEGEPESPLGDLAAAAAEEGYTRRNSGEAGPRPYHGYYFKMLLSQGSSAPGGAKDYVVNGHMSEGFAVVAWPAQYGNSGIMTFLVSHQGVVYQRDLGKGTHRAASAMRRFDPGPRWSIVEEDASIAP